ncbi:MAG: ankyrin repeat domain-containing protein [Pseudomonadota bacterium]|nr:ankyrin repeat domain-containing protein [Pseudomonadota bacterium]
MKTLLLIAILCTTACIIKNRQAQGKFIAAQAGNQVKLKLLMPLIFNQQWKIGYRYGVDCKPADRQNDVELRAAISKTLRVWLEPIKELQPARPLVDKFVYELQADFDPVQPGDSVSRNIEEDLQGWRRMDLRVTFQCTHGRSNAAIGDKLPPAVFVRSGIETTPAMLATLAHEIGHAFGLLDTYSRALAPSHGGLEATLGIQPASIMAMASGFHSGERKHLPPAISEDDKRGVVWLYKFFHNNQPIKDCFFADYVYVERPDAVAGACRPKHPIIFEAKHNPSKHTIQILKDDPNLNVNAQDVSGMTALHYAVMYERVDIVKALLAHAKINLDLKNKHGKTAFDLALETNNARITALFPAPKQEKETKQAEKPLNVAPRNKVITTWGAIKSE